jgi:hypothetical protein
MLYLAAACWAWYGGDVERLGHREYAVRAAAHSRLQAAGAWAVPALWVGRRTGSPERVMRVESILARRASVWRKAIWAVLSRPDVTDDQLRLVGEVMAADPELASQVYAAVDHAGGFWSASSEQWARSRPYHTADLAGENVHVLRAVRNARLFATPVGSPRPAPDPQP